MASTTTAGQLEEQIRQRFNAVGDGFFSSGEIWDLLVDAQNELALETDCIEKVFSTTTVNGTREYEYPTNAYRIHRVQWNGKRLDPNDFMLDDLSTGNSADTTSTGEPINYQIWGDTMFLRPVPDAAQTLKVFCNVTAQDITVATQTLDIPERYVRHLKDYCLAAMFAKSGARVRQFAQYHDGRWQKAINDVKRVEMKRKQGDQYSVIKSDEQMPWHDSGMV